MSKLDLKPLQCPGCGGAVPVGEQGDSVDCPYCKQPFALPAEYVEVRSHQAARRRQEQELAGSYARLAEPPSLLIQLGATSAVFWTMLVTVLVAGGFLFACVVAIVALVQDFSMGFGGAMVAAVGIWIMFVPIWFEWLLRSLWGPLGWDPADVLTGGQTQALLGILIYLFLVAPTVLLIWADTLATLRARIQGLMAARPPQTEGGPSACRVCGAALELPQGELGVRCLYCDTDNLLRISPSLLQEVKEESADFSRTADEAIKHERDTRSDTRRWAFRTLAWWLLLIPVLYGLGWLTERLVEEDPGFQPWAFTRTMVSHRPYHEPLPEGRSKLVFSPAETNTMRSQTYFYVALRKGDKLSLSSEGNLTWMVQRRTLGRWYRPEWQWEDVEDPVLVADHQGWYRVRLKAPYEEQGQDQTLEWHIDP